jgi:two-component system, LuxR family, sensor kinase FixL
VCSAGSVSGQKNEGVVSTNQDSDLQSLVAWSDAVLETAVDAIVSITSTGTIHRVNQATLKMFGYSRDELVGRNVSMLMPQPHRSEHDGHLRRYLETGIAGIIGIGRRVTACRSDGSEFPVHLAVSEFSLNGKRMFNGIVRDLTELEKVHQQLLQSERLVAIGEMMTGLAHESRNALQRAQACLDMLSLDLVEHPEQLDLARRAAGALQDLHRLYEEVRGYAAPIHLEVRSCDLAATWRKQWDYLAATRDQRKITLSEIIESDSTLFEIDVHRMEQVFRNVFENAIFACGEEGLITVRCRDTELMGRPALLIQIDDDGCGLTSEAARQIFDPFFTTKQRGTGLGMAIVKRIVESHFGTITASPAAERGTRISMILPVGSMVRNAFRTVSAGVSDDRRSPDFRG